jgi:hypothetical protein
MEEIRGATNRTRSYGNSGHLTCGQTLVLDSRAVNSRAHNLEYYSRTRYQLEVITPVMIQMRASARGMSLQAESQTRRNYNYMTTRFRNHATITGCSAMP